MNAITKEHQAALSLPERAAVALGTAAHEIKLRELVNSSADIVAVIDAPGREQAHRIGMNLKGARVAIEKVGKTAREDATAFSKAIIAEEKRLIAIAEPEELRILNLRDGFDQVEQARKDAAIAAERARTEAIQVDIQSIRDLVTKSAGKPSHAIAAAIEVLRVIQMTGGRFEEFADAAIQAGAQTGDTLGGMYDDAIASEAAALAAEQARIAEVERIAAEVAQLAADRAELAEQQRAAKVEADRIAEIARLNAESEAKQRKAEADLQAAREAAFALVQAEHAAEVKRVRDIAAAEQAERERLAVDAKRQLDAQQAAIAAERAAFLREQEEAAARAKLEADHAEALIDNATFDDAMTRLAAVDTPTFCEPSGDLARCTATAQAMLTNGRSLIADSIDAYVGGGLAEDDEPVIDYEAIAWAYQKLLAFGVGNGSMDNAMMLDRLNLMLLTAEVAA